MKPKTIVNTIGLALIPFAIWYEAFVLSNLWEWFVTPEFGVTVPSYPILLGLVLVASWPGLGLRIKTYSLVRTGSKGDEDTAKALEEVVIGFLVATLYLFTGWIYTLFM